MDNAFEIAVGLVVGVGLVMLIILGNNAHYRNTCLNPDDVTYCVHIDKWVPVEPDQ